MPLPSNSARLALLRLGRGRLGFAGTTTTPADSSQWSATRTARADARHKLTADACRTSSVECASVEQAFDSGGYVSIEGGRAGQTVEARTAALAEGAVTMQTADTTQMIALDTRHASTTLVARQTQSTGASERGQEVDADV